MERQTPESKPGTAGETKNVVGIVVRRLVVRLWFRLRLALNSFEVAALMHAAAECPARRVSAEEDRIKLYKKRLEILAERRREFPHNKEFIGR